MFERVHFSPVWQTLKTPSGVIRRYPFLLHLSLCEFVFSFRQQKVESYSVDHLKAPSFLTFVFVPRLLLSNRIPWRHSFCGDLCTLDWIIVMPSEGSPMKRNCGTFSGRARLISLAASRGFGWIRMIHFGENRLSLPQKLVHVVGCLLLKK